MISYQKYTKDDTKLAREVILKHSLHNTNYSAGSAFWAFAEYGTFLELIEEFVVTRFNDIPIGIAFKLRGYGMYGANITCYVKHGFRRKGIGSAMVNMFSYDYHNNRGFPVGFPKCQHT
jgi:GNAT superfamily N-acetyltransferase